MIITIILNILYGILICEGIVVAVGGGYFIWLDVRDSKSGGSYGIMPDRERKK